MGGVVSQGLRFRVSRLGSVAQGAFEQRPLTIFCGPSNAGKTWTMYALHHFLTALPKPESGTEPKPLEIAELNDSVSRSLHLLFNAEPERFADSSFRIEDTPGGRELLRSPGSRPEVFLMPAERNGLHLFHRELGAHPGTDIPELLAKYIDWLNSLAELEKHRSREFHPLAEKLEKSIAGGAYRVQPDTGEIAFSPCKKGDAQKPDWMPLHLAPSAAKSLFGLWFYLEHQAKAGGALLLDEPELNMHPENQRRIARLLAQLVDAGLNIVVSTHSDYLVRELNTLIMLSGERSEALRRRYGYDADETLNADAVGAYLFDGQTIEPFRVTPEDGIHATTFDAVIETLNRTSDDIYYSLQEMQLETEECRSSNGWS